MHLTTFLLLSLSTIAAALPSTSLYPSQIEKRCRVGRGIVPCWVLFDTFECSPHRDAAVSYTIDRANNQVIVTGVCSNCTQALALERRVEKNNSWLYGTYGSQTGQIEDRGNGTIVISDLRKGALDAYEELTVWVRGGVLESSCVDLEMAYGWMNLG